jgi:integrative and conjugative element protein (TIGR02256 family)
MAAEAQRMAPLESGGVLLGWHGSDGLEVIVVDVLGPGPGATHMRTMFEPDADWQCAGIARAYEKSGRVLSYLGDWHSHPGGSERPSRRDERTARRIARSRHARAQRPLMLIMSGIDGEWHLTPYRCLRMRLHLMEVVTIAAGAAAAASLPAVE